MNDGVTQPIPKTFAKGDRVTDGKNFGIVRAVHPGAFVIVKWDESGWISQLPFHAVDKIEQQEQE